MSPSPKKSLAVEDSPNLDRPLRQRRRRDGTMALTNANGQVADDAVFPSPMVFQYRWLLENGTIARLDGDTVTLTYVNASAAYKVERHLSLADDGVEGLLCTCTETKVGKAPPIDEKVAEKIAKEVAKARAEQALADARALLAQEA